MRAFISDSVNNKNERLITLLSSFLSERGFYVEGSDTPHTLELDRRTKSQINNAHLFIGVITDNGAYLDRVTKDWQYAEEKKIPNILLIEDTVPLNYNFTGNYIRFNRKNPQQAIDTIQARMYPPAPVESSKNNNSANDVFAWLLGGAVLIALLGAFSSANTTQR